MERISKITEKVVERLITGAVLYLTGLLFGWRLN